MHDQSKTPHVTGNVQLKERKRGGPVWRARIRRADGSQINRTIGLASLKKKGPSEGDRLNRAEAEELLRDMIREEREAAASPTPATVTFAEAADEWLADCERNALAESTMTDYRATARALVAAFGDRPLETVTQQHLEAYRTELLAADRRPGPRTANRHQVVCGAIYRRARARWGTMHNPTVGMRKLREPRYDGEGLNVLKPHEVQQLVAATDDLQEQVLYLVATGTGLRMGELFALRWRDVDFDAKRVQVARSYCHRTRSFGSTKSRRRRSVPMAPQVAQALARMSQRDRWTEPDDLVFPGWDGTALDHTEVRSAFYSALKRAGLRRIRFHDLRHTFGTTAAATKRDLVAVQTWMGHASITTTMIYAHHVPADDDAELLGEAFTASLAPTAQPVAA